MRQSNSYEISGAWKNFAFAEEGIKTAKCCVSTMTSKGKS